MMESESTALPLGYTPVYFLSSVSADLIIISQFRRDVNQFPKNRKKKRKVEFVLKNQMLNIDCTIEIKRFVLIFTVHFSKLTFCSWHDIMAIPHKERLATLHAICLQISLQSLFRIFPHASCVHIFRDISGKYSKIHKGFSPFSPSSLKKSDDAICIRQIRNRLSYFTKMLVNTSSIHSAFCFI